MYFFHILLIADSLGMPETCFARILLAPLPRELLKWVPNWLFVSIDNNFIYMKKHKIYNIKCHNLFGKYQIYKKHLM